MRTNKLVWIGLGLMMVFVVIVVINKFNEPAPQNTATVAKKEDPKKKVTPVAIEGDTIVETMKQTNARYEASQQRVKELQTENALINERLESLERRNGTAKGDNRLDLAMNKFGEMSGELQNLTSQFMQQQEKFETTSANGYEFTDSDLGWDKGSSSTTKNKGNGSKSQELAPSYRKLAGYASVPVISNTATPSIDFETPTAKEDELNQSGLTGLDELVEVDEITPYYTIPARSTLLDAVAMTAMIGRVPIGDKLKDPFPVKIIVGNKNLATNGLSIPGLDGIVFEGIATGDWNLSCVSVALTAATFTFQDGRVQHLESNGGQKSAISSLNPIGESKNKNSIGYISNKLGVPCIPGQKVTDAPKKLATVGILGLAGSYFNAKAESEVTNRTDIAGGSNSTVTGDAGKFEANRTAADAIGTVNEFYLSRNRTTFDAVVVQPGADLVLHITSDLLIDYHSNARKLVYSHNTGGSHANSLD